MTTSKQDFHCKVNVNSLAFNQANNRAIANVTTLYGKINSKNLWKFSEVLPLTCLGPHNSSFKLCPIHAGRPDCQIDAPSDEELDVMHYDLPKKIFRLTPTLQKEPAKGNF